MSFGKNCGQEKHDEKNSMDGCDEGEANESEFNGPTQMGVKIEEHVSWDKIRMEQWNWKMSK